MLDHPHGAGAGRGALILWRRPPPGPGGLADSALAQGNRTGHGPGGPASACPDGSHLARLRSDQGPRVLLDAAPPQAGRGALESMPRAAAERMLTGSRDRLAMLARRGERRALRRRTHAGPTARSGPPAGQGSVERTERNAGRVIRHLFGGFTPGVRGLFAVPGCTTLHKEPHVHGRTMQEGHTRPSARTSQSGLVYQLPSSGTKTTRREGRTSSASAAKTRKGEPHSGDLR